MEAGWEVGVAPWLQRPTLLSKDMEPLQARTTWRRSHLASPRRSKLSNGRGETCSARCPRAGTLVHWCQSCWTGHSAQRGPAPRAGRRSELGINWSRRQQERGFGNARGGLGISRGVYECRQRCHGPFWQVMPSAKLLRVRDVCPVPKSTELYGLCPLSATERP